MKEKAVLLTAVILFYTLFFFVSWLLAYIFAILIPWLSSEKPIPELCILFLPLIFLLAFSLFSYKPSSIFVNRYRGRIASTILSSAPLLFLFFSVFTRIEDAELFSLISLVSLIIAAIFRKHKKLLLIGFFVLISISSISLHSFSIIHYLIYFYLLFLTPLSLFYLLRVIKNLYKTQRYALCLSLSLFYITPPIALGMLSLAIDWPIGHIPPIEGRVIDKTTKEPIPYALVELDTVADERGRFSTPMSMINLTFLHASPSQMLKERFCLSATHPLYVEDHSCITVQQKRQQRKRSNIIKIDVELESLEERYVEPIRKIKEKIKMQNEKIKMTEQNAKLREEEIEKLKDEIWEAVDSFDKFLCHWGAPQYFETIREKNIPIDLEPIFAEWERVAREMDKVLVSVSMRQDGMAIVSIAKEKAEEIIGGREQ
jgi:ABC-type multidrug transport system fused ATPase/permease subunit